MKADYGKIAKCIREFSEEDETRKRGRCALLRVRTGNLPSYGYGLTARACRERTWMLSMAESVIADSGKAFLTRRTKEFSTESYFECGSRKEAEEVLEEASMITAIADSATASGACGEFPVTVDIFLFDAVMAVDGDGRPVTCSVDDCDERFRMIGETRSTGRLMMNRKFRKLAGVSHYRTDGMGQGMLSLKTYDGLIADKAAKILGTMHDEKRRRTKALMEAERAKMAETLKALGRAEGGLS